MRIKIIGAETSIRYVPLDEIGIQERAQYNRFREPWTYDVINEQKFFLAVIKYGLTYEVYQHECSM
jgi:hypothetical protein